MKDIITIFGKTQKKDAFEKNIWKKRLIFFDLPYWSNVDVQHCIDVMHVEKNVCDNLIDTLLNIKGKIKDGLKYHQDFFWHGYTRTVTSDIRRSIYVFAPNMSHNVNKREFFLPMFTEFENPIRIIFKYQEPSIREWSQIGCLEVSWLTHVNATTVVCSHSRNVAWQS